MKDWSKTVGMAIYNRRMDLGLTAKALAERAGITSASLYLTEAGTYGLRAHNLFKIAKVLGCSMDDLYIDVDRNHPPAASQISSRTGAER